MTLYHIQNHIQIIILCVAILKSWDGNLIVLSLTSQSYQKIRIYRFYWDFCHNLQDVCYAIDYQ